MSSQLTQYVSVFNGNGWLLWCSQMCTYLMAQGQGAFITPGSSEPTVNATPAALGAQASATEINTFNEANHVRATQISARNEWRKTNDMTVGNIMLRLSPALQQGLRSHDNAAELQDVLKNIFGKQTLPSVYKDFKEAISVQLNLNQHPAAQFDKLAAAFGCLAHVTIGTEDDQHTLKIQEELQALITLAALPPKWETMIALIMQNFDLADISLKAVRKAIINQYETETNRGQHKGSQHANKISAVKHKRGNPDLNKQESQKQCQSSGSSSKPSGNQQQPRQRGAGGSGSNKKGKDKLHQQPAHSHVASVAALRPPTSHTIMHIGSSSMTQHVVSEPTPPTRTSGPYFSLNKVLMLTERLEVKPTIQTVKTLEQRFVEFDDTVRTHCKGVHSLMPNLGCVIGSGGLV